MPEEMLDNLQFDMMVAYEAYDRNWTTGSQDTVKQWMNNVAEIESNNQPSRVQMGGGPGRGKYQVEVKAGKGSGSNETYLTRLANWERKHYKLALSTEDRKEINSLDPDFSKMSEEAQDIIFLASHSMGATKLDDLASGALTGRDAWTKYHWAGASVSPNDTQKEIEGKLKALASKEAMWDSRINSQP